MATAVGTPYSPPSPPDTSSSATMSPVYPDRPIRPLPKRSLRARLSPEVADQIPFPAVPQISSNVFGHYKDTMTLRNGATVTNSIQEVDKVLPSPSQEYDTEGHESYRFRGNPVDSEDEDQIGMVRRLEEFQTQQGMVPLASRGLTNGMIRNTEGVPQSVASSNDSVDGYDSFENTNNKKKRKIPTSGGLGTHHTSLSTSLSNDLANMGISGPKDVGLVPEGLDRVGQYYGSGTSAFSASNLASGNSGPGRGRLGRSTRRDANGRSPLSLATGNVSNAWPAGRASGPRREFSGGVNPGKDHGIISTAIAEAAILPKSQPSGENVSLLEQQSTKKPAPANSQFTFTCEPDSKGMTWPSESSHFAAGSYKHRPENTGSHVPLSSQNHKGFSTQGTQTSPTMAGQNSQAAAGSHGPAQQTAQPPPKPRRSPSKRYALAERQRRVQQQYNNYNHPPRDDDIWICEFCEYESIFGVPPIALVRQYEIKDARERKRLAEKRRLLEKAKMKGRKAKKGSKNPKSVTSTAQPSQEHATQQNASRPGGGGVAMDSHGTQSDDYYGEDYEDEELQVPEATRHEAPSRIPRPATRNDRQNPQVAHTNGT